MEKILEFVRGKLERHGRYEPFVLSLSRSDLKEAYCNPSTYGPYEIGVGEYLIFPISSVPNITHNLQMQDCFIFHALNGLSSGPSIKLPIIRVETSDNKIVLELTYEIIPIKKAYAHVYIGPDLRRRLDEDFCIAYAALASWTRAEKEFHRQIVEELMQVSRRPELRVELPEISLPQPSIISLIGYLSESSRADLYMPREIQKVPLLPERSGHLHGRKKPCLLLPANYQESISLVKMRDPRPQLINQILESCIILPYQPPSDYAPMISFWPSSLHFFINEQVNFDIQRDYQSDEMHVKCTIYYGFYFLEEEIKVIPDIPEALRKLAS